MLAIILAVAGAGAAGPSPQMDSRASGSTALEIANGGANGYVVAVSRRDVLADLATGTDLRVRLAGAFDDTPVSMAFADLPVLEAVEHVLRRQSYVVVTGSGGTAKRCGDRDRALVPISRLRPEVSSLLALAQTGPLLGRVGVSSGVGPAGRARSVATGVGLGGASGGVDGAGFSGVENGTGDVVIVHGAEVTLLLAASDGLAAELRLTLPGDASDSDDANAPAPVLDALTAAGFGGDGHDDLALGLPGIDDAAGTGKVVVLRSSPQGVTSDAGGRWRQVFDDATPPAAGGDHHGAALTNGDFNGDGIDDLAVGSPSSDAAAPDAGLVRVFLGSLEGLETRSGGGLVGRGRCTSRPRPRGRPCRRGRACGSGGHRHADRFGWWGAAVPWDRCWAVRRPHR